jgi:hypothetical protein
VAIADLKEDFNVLDLLRPPFFATGDPRREWQFQFLLTLPMLGGSVGSRMLSALFGSVILLYVSGLAEKVTIPSSKFNLAPTQFSNIPALFPKGVELPSLQVQYLEDELGLVGLFHRLWQSFVLGMVKDNKDGSVGHGAVFQELGGVGATAFYAPARITTDDGGRRWEVPLGAEVWPLVFPVDISPDPANRAGNNLAKVTVTYARIPVWDMSENIYEWTDSNGNAIITTPGSWASMSSSGLSGS